MSNDDISKVLNKVKKGISPDNNVLTKVDKVVNEINTLLRKDDVDAECVKGGSIAKGTFLKNDYDADLFVRYNMSYRDVDISDMTAKYLKKFKPQRIHGSRDYFQFNTNNVAYEVIPVIKVHASNYTEALNITDLSPEHVIWVKKHTDSKKELTDDIRLAKQFCKANNVYGAESYINGFSGHILDILVIHFGSFINLVKYFASLHEKNITILHPIIIDTEHHMGNALKELNPSKISPLIIIDPIQKDRNSAAALSAEKLNDFIAACKSFMKKPSEDLFKIKKFILESSIKKDIHDIGKGKFKTIILDIHTLEGSKDVVGTKILKAFQDIKNHLEMNDFIILKSGWNFEFEKRSATIYMIFRDIKLQRVIEHAGPPLSRGKDCQAFKEKHEFTYIKNNRLYARVERTFVDPVDFIKDFTKKNFIAKRYTNISIRT